MAENMTTAETVRATTKKSETAFELMLNAIQESISDLASSDNKQDGEDKEDNKEEIQRGTLSDDDEAGWRMGKISKTVQHCMESVW